MKFLYISILILLSVAILATVNCIYINNVSNRILGLCDEASLPDQNNTEDIAKTIYEFWQDERDLVALSVPFPQIDRVDDYVASLLSAAKSGDKSEFMRSLQLLRGAAEEIARLEKLSFANIF